MINDDIIAVKDSDYDFYVVLKDGTEKPVFVLRNIYKQLDKRRSLPVDVLADYKSNFERLSVLPAIERTIAQTGVAMYER